MPGAKRVPVSHFYDFGEFRVDPEQKLLFLQGELVSLTPKAFETLLVLVESHGHMVDKETLLRRVWPGAFVEEGSLTRNISVLRKVLEEGARGQQWIETIPKRGYRFVAGVRVVKRPDEISARGATDPQQTAVRSDKHSSPERRPPNRLRRLILGVGGAGMALAVVILLLDLADRHLVRGSSSAAGIHSLAVLPLSNLSRDPDQEYFADGMTDALITDLAKIRSLRIVSRTSVMQYKTTHKTVGQIARELGVDGIVEGTVLRSGNRVRVTAQLIRAENDDHLWAEMYERDLGDALTLQGEVAQAIADQVRIQVTPDERAQLSGFDRVNPEVYDWYLRGRYYWNKRDADGLNRATVYFQQAIQKDPQFALAYAGLADCYNVIVESVSVSPPEALTKAKTAALKALSLDDNLAEAHASLAWVHFQLDWDWAGADREFRRAIELNPGYATAHHWYAQYLAAMGRAEEAMGEMNRAQQLDPLSLIIRLDTGAVEYWCRHLDWATEREQEVIEMDPAYVRAYFYLAISYADKGMFEESLEKFRKGMELSGPGTHPYREIEAWIYASNGRRGDATRIIRDVLAENAPVESYYLAEAYAALGNRDAAFEMLDRAYRSHTYWMVYLRVDPRLDPLRSDPRFQQLLRRVGFTAPPVRESGCAENGSPAADRGYAQHPANRSSASAPSPPISAASPTQSSSSLTSIRPNHCA